MAAGARCTYTGYTILAIAPVAHAVTHVSQVNLKATWYEAHGMYAAESK